MSVMYGRFEMPTKIKVEKATKTDKFARFVAEPFERGFGHTIGNSIRRIMLSSLEAPAVVSIYFEGVPHEYMAIEGVIEDMTNIILNLKGILIKPKASITSSEMKMERIVSTDLSITASDLSKNGGQYSVTLKDLVNSDMYEVVNPDHHLFTVTKPMEKRIDLKIAIGRGYVSSERIEVQKKVKGEILLDAIFSPIRLFNYYIENTRVGQDIDFDRLIMEVTTDGRIDPTEAVAFASQIVINHFNVFKELGSYELSFEKEYSSVDSGKDEMMQKLSLRIDEIELSVRSTNCLNNADIATIAELVIKPEIEMLKFRNFGKKSLTEIKAKLNELGMSLGMDLSLYGITEENVVEVITDYNEKKSKRSKHEA